MVYDDVEALARPEVRASLSPGRMLRLYLDPFALFKNVTVGTQRARAEALEYNRRHRAILLAYVRRWAFIALGCIVSLAPLESSAGAGPALCVPIVGLELGFSVSFCAALISLTLYIVLGVAKDIH